MPFSVGMKDLAKKHNYKCLQNSSCYDNPTEKRIFFNPTPHTKLSLQLPTVNFIKNLHPDEGIEDDGVVERVLFLISRVHPVILLVDASSRNIKITGSCKEERHNNRYLIGCLA